MANTPHWGGGHADGSPTMTSATLLKGLQQRDEQAWERFVRLYGPTVYSWCRHQRLSAEDAADVGQEVFIAVARSITGFRHDPPHSSFRGWLWRITRNKILDHLRRNKRRHEAPGGTTGQNKLVQMPDEESEDSEPSPTSPTVQSLWRRALELIQTEFTEPTWRAFLLVAVEGRSTADVATELGTSKGAVYIAKSRILSRLRNEFAGLIR